jgi:hypothetical protein
MFACSSQPSMSHPPEPSVAATPRAPQPQLWGELKPIVSVKELMRDMLDPAAPTTSSTRSKIVYTRKGAVETTPKTEKDWDKIRIGAVTLVEGVYLLKIPRPFAPPGDENNSTGPEATELSPAQNQQRSSRRTPCCGTPRSKRCETSDSRSSKSSRPGRSTSCGTRGHNLDQACESCHLQYWYPGDKALLQKNRSRHPGTLRAVAACRAKTGRGR